MEKNVETDIFPAASNQSKAKVQERPVRIVFERQG